jgi:putative CocE/NonD family hydrolase
MTAIAPEVAGVGGIHRGVNWHMFMNAYARVVGKGAGKEPVSLSDMERQMLVETLTNGYYNASLDWEVPEELLLQQPDLRELPLPEIGKHLWRRYCSLPPAERARLLKTVLRKPSVTLENLESLPPIFGRRHPDEHLTPFPTVELLYRSLHAPALIISGWYDWGLDATLRTWGLLSKYADRTVRDRSRLLIAPSAHNAPGYHEGAAFEPTLRRTFRGLDNIDLLLAWYGSMLHGGVPLPPLPRITYYLMGAGEWSVADEWPPPRMRVRELFLAEGGRLSERLPELSEPDFYVFDPTNPTPTVAGSYVSAVYRPGSGDVSGIHMRPDVAVYSTEPLARPLDVVGPLRFVLYASSTARDTDFAVRLSDVFPDGRAIQLQNGIIRARYRNPDAPVELMEPDRVYRFEIDMWATANRFQAGHRLRIDISSADFPRFDRNANLGGVEGPPVSAGQRIFHDPERPSHLLLPVMP